MKYWFGSGGACGSSGGLGVRVCVCAVVWGEEYARSTFVHIRQLPWVLHVANETYKEPQLE